MDASCTKNNITLIHEDIKQVYHKLFDKALKEYNANENVLNTHINRLRLKLKSNAEDSTAYVKTLWGIGYKMEEK